MSATTNLRLPYLLPAQSQKHVTVNESLRILDALVQGRVESFGDTIPPENPVDGTVYIPGSGATGAWHQFDFNVVYYVDGAWVKIPPKTGWSFYIISEDVVRTYQGPPIFWRQVTARQQITSNKTIQVNSASTSTNPDGLTPESAFPDIQQAIDYVSSLDRSIYDVEIYCVGNFSTANGIECKTGPGSGKIIIKGQGQNQTTLTQTENATSGRATFFSNNHSTLYEISDFKVISQGSGTTGILATRSTINFARINFGTGFSVHFRTDLGGVINSLDTYTISGSAGRHMQSSNYGFIRQVSHGAVVIEPGVHFANEFARAHQFGTIAANLQYSGNSSGRRYLVSRSSIINSIGGGETRFPGDTDGIVNSSEFCRYY